MIATSPCTSVLRLPDELHPLPPPTLPHIRPILFPDTQGLLSAPVRIGPMPVLYPVRRDLAGQRT